MITLEQIEHGQIASTKFRLDKIYGAFSATANTVRHAKRLDLLAIPEKSPVFICDSRTGRLIRKFRWCRKISAIRAA